MFKLRVNEAFSHFGFLCAENPQSHQPDDVSSSTYSRVNAGYPSKVALYASDRDPAII
jgi:hypothetical protein